MAKAKYFVVVVADCTECGGSGIRTEGFRSPHTGEWDRREINCPECEGSGTGERRVDLADALEDLIQPGNDLAIFLSEVLAITAQGPAKAARAQLAAQRERDGWTQ